MVLPSDTDAVSAVEYAEAARRLILALDIAHPKGPVGRLSVSFGVAAMIPKASGSPDALLAAADAALYEAKRLGRNRVVEPRGARHDGPLERPGCAALAVLVRDERVLLVRRAIRRMPASGDFRADAIEWGETPPPPPCGNCAKRRGLPPSRWAPSPCSMRSTMAPMGVLRHHYLLVAILCRAERGRAGERGRGGDDALEVGGSRPPRSRGRPMK